MRMAPPKENTGRRMTGSGHLLFVRMELIPIHRIEKLFWHTSIGYADHSMGTLML